MKTPTEMRQLTPIHADRVAEDALRDKHARQAREDADAYKRQRELDVEVGRLRRDAPDATSVVQFVVPTAPTAETFARRNALQFQAFTNVARAYKFAGVNELPGESDLNAEIDRLITLGGGR